ncbi:MAG: hypothetical protein HRU03_03465 [Nanoarchaeales archaeon]|nr:hypothetical protein [Nanoarchaeales archaeon]
MAYVFMVRYKLKDEVNKDDFKKSVKKVVTNFYDKQEGFISLNLGYNEKENIFSEVHTWKEKSFTETAHPKFMGDKNCLAVFGMCEMESMSMTDLTLLD